jgi:hypothetical protein
MVHNPDLQWGCQKMTDEAGGQNLGQPLIAALRLDDPRDDDPPPEEKEGDREDNHDDRVRADRAVVNGYVTHRRTLLAFVESCRIEEFSFPSGHHRLLSAKRMIATL